MEEHWPEFSARLRDALTGLAGRDPAAALIIMDAAEPSRMVQYHCGGDVRGVWAEVSSNKFLPEHRRLSKDDERRLRTAGWDRPGGPWWAPFLGLPNWSTGRFAHPRADVGPLADMSVTALRDVLRIGSPAGLAYEAFVLDTGEPITLGELAAGGLHRARGRE